jgi:RHS repeat-associated protein
VVSLWAVSWNPARFSSYGPVPGYQQSTLSLNTPVAQSLGWRGKRVDETGYINLGARLYDPVAGRFISADPLGHAASQDLYSFCGGDPVNRFDPTGRCPSPLQARTDIPPLFSLPAESRSMRIG